MISNVLRNQAANPLCFVNWDFVHQQLLQSLYVQWQLANTVMSDWRVPGTWKYMRFMHFMAEWIGKHVDDGLLSIGTQTARQKDLWGGWESCAMVKASAPYLRPTMCLERILARIQTSICRSNIYAKHKGRYNWPLWHLIPLNNIIEQYCY